jgi:hypothetical protein
MALALPMPDAPPVTNATFPELPDIRRERLTHTEQS